MVTLFILVFKRTEGILSYWLSVYDLLKYSHEHTPELETGALKAMFCDLMSFKITYHISGIIILLSVVHSMDFIFIFLRIA